MISDKIPNYRQAIKRCKNCKFMLCEFYYPDFANKLVCDHDHENRFQTFSDCVCDEYEPMENYAETNETTKEKFNEWKDE